MKITAQEEYGLRCLLRVAKEPDGRASTLPEIAESEGLSVPYVAKLMSVLRRADVIESVRGRSGGYRLAKAPGDIGLGSLLLVLGEPLFDEEEYCQRHAGLEGNKTCVHQGSCNLRDLWQTLEHWIRSTLDQITLADLIQSENQIVDLVKRRLAETVADDSSGLIPLHTVVSS